MDFGLKDKRALVLASSRGLGLGIAQAIAAEGASVTLVGRNRDGLIAEADAINRRGGKAAPLVADLSAGPAYDRYAGRGGPLLGAGISWIDDGAFSSGFNTGYGRGVGRDASEYTVIGGFARWRM